jgi:hypothetical protein
MAWHGMAWHGMAWHGGLSRHAREAESRIQASVDQLGGSLLLHLVAEKTRQRLNFCSHAQLLQTPPVPRQQLITPVVLNQMLFFLKNQFK